MEYGYQWFGAMTGWAFVYGCVLGMLSPTTYLPTAARIRPKTSPARSDGD